MVCGIEKRSAVLARLKDHVGLNTGMLRRDRGPTGDLDWRTMMEGRSQQIGPGSHYNSCQCPF